VSRAGAYLSALQAELGGTLSFERFMREALYNPAFGYYSSRIQTVGRRGDFSTWATLDNSLAQGIAQWLKKSRARHVIEIGAGSGDLARDVLKSLGWWTRRRISYHIVEVSEPLETKQRAALQGSKIRWHRDMKNALAATGGEAFIFSNEVPDAFPCRIFEKSGAVWKELHLRLEEKKFHEVLVPADLPDSTVFDHPFSDGCRVEVHTSYRDWLMKWASDWKLGSMLTIDYGDTMPHLYHRRPRGTIRGYAHHQLLTGQDLTIAPGRCDLTADVNFSDLERWGTQAGWHTLSHTSLKDFLSTMLPTESENPRLSEAGQAFRALLQACPTAQRPLTGK
jgi:SAM-dependent MidA family methyltransferase